MDFLFFSVVLISYRILLVTTQKLIIIDKIAAVLFQKISGGKRFFKRLLFFSLVCLTNLNPKQWSALNSSVFIFLVDEEAVRE